MEYTLPDTILSIIGQLSKQFIDTPVITTSTTSPYSNRANDAAGFHNARGANAMLKKKKYSNGNNVQKEVTNESWEHLRSFKTTKIEKKEGNDKIMNDIRICLNKISNKNYEVQRDALLQHIALITESNVSADDEEPSSDNLKKIGKSIFDIASTNHFYSELYATLYKELISHNSLFYEILDGFILQYLASVKEIIYVDPAADYDKHCEYNKSNDKRKALSMFVVNLMKKSILEKEAVVNLLIELQSLLFEYTSQPNHINEIEEIMENLYIISTNAKSELVSHDKWALILDQFKQFSQFKVKEKTSLSSRAIFKCMDILDKLAK